MTLKFMAYFEQVFVNNSQPCSGVFFVHFNWVLGSSVLKEVMYGPLKYMYYIFIILEHSYENTDTRNELIITSK